MINIFAKEAFLNTNPSQPFKERTKPVVAGHLQRVSSMIRGDQIADYIGANLNPDPETTDPNDTNIYVKPMVRKGADLEMRGKAWIDIIDGHNLGQVALKHPEVGIITCSEVDAAAMRSCVPNKVVCIPQHHCNFERLQHDTYSVETVGVIGTEDSFKHIPESIEKGLAEYGVKLLKYSKFFTRQDIIDFYMQIDVQLVWRPYKKRLSNPLKIVNAGSFSIPTVALDESAFEEVYGMYVPVSNADRALSAIINLHLLEFDYSKAENYHISKIAERYKALCTI